MRKKNRRKREEASFPFLDRSSQEMTQKHEEGKINEENFRMNMRKKLFQDPP